MEEIYMMWLSRLEGIGVQKIKLLLQKFSSPEAIWNAEKDELLQVKGLGEVNADRILSSRNSAQLEKWAEELEKKQIRFISMLHPQYPKLLKEIYDPPVGLYLKGNLPAEDINTVSVVGARRCSLYGANVAYKLSKDLGKVNIAVVSGMARGIDSMAHKGVLDGGGQTIAVLGCGVDICYPAENRALMERIMENGCVVSEYPPGSPIAPHNFPVRNRIISGLSTMTIVIEAARRSGTLITADQALENGRDVFVVPGNITSAFSEGTNDLIKQGCPIITSYQDVLFELGITYNEKETKTFQKQMSETLEVEERNVLNCIFQEPIHAEEIAQKLQMSIQDVQYILSVLELSGYIQKLPQAGYIKV
ncbi:MAG: DNA-protecting protein DprA [Epulopiscium sp.]|nr:DNA-protecting protein DprA [Candidatus Epulonipiscium sp.]